VRTSSFLAQPWCPCFIDHIGFRSELVPGWPWSHGPMRPRLIAGQGLKVSGFHVGSMTSLSWDLGINKLKWN
jgi:hypothetical protein